MSDPLHEGGLIIAPRPQRNRQTEPGVWKHQRPNTDDPDVKTADFSYQNDDIANMIVQAWTNAGFRNGLLQGNIANRTTNAQAALQGLANPINMASPIVITEDEYDAGWDSDSPNQVVFVLPNRARQGGDLFENAKLLMACVPNGI
jgi:hypothetical protein